MVTLEPTSCTYDGSAKTPAVKVELGGKVLEAGTDYDVAYSGNVNASARLRAHAGVW